MRIISELNIFFSGGCFSRAAGGDFCGGTSGSGGGAGVDAAAPPKIRAHPYRGFGEEKLKRDREREGRRRWIFFDLGIVDNVMMRNRHTFFKARYGMSLRVNCLADRGGLVTAVGMNTFRSCVYTGPAGCSRAGFARERKSRGWCVCVVSVMIDFQHIILL